MKLDKLSDDRAPPLRDKTLPKHEPEAAPGIHGPNQRVAYEGHSALHKTFRMLGNRRNNARRPTTQTQNKNGASQYAQKRDPRDS